MKKYAHITEISKLGIKQTKQDVGSDGNKEEKKDVAYKGTITWFPSDANIKMLIWFDVIHHDQFSWV